MRRKKVVIDVNSTLLYFVKGWVSGVGRSTFELVTALDHYARSHDLPFDIVLYSQNTKGVTARRLNTSFRCAHLYYPHRYRWNKALSHTPLVDWATGGYDLLHIPHNFECVRHPEKTVVTIHDAMCLKLAPYYASMNHLRENTQQLTAACKGIITCSESSKTDIVEGFQVAPSKVHTIYWGAGFSAQAPCLNKAHYFLTLSCDALRKNTLSVIYAFKTFLQQNPATDYKLKIVWTNMPREIKYLCADELESGRIEVLENVADDTIAQLYAHARATLFLSLYEGFGFPLVESMQSGTPVVTCRNSSLHEIGGEAAVYVAPYNLTEIAETMRQLTLDTPEYAQLQEAGLARAKAFTWEKCAAQTIALYQQLLFE